MTSFGLRLSSFVLLFTFIGFGQAPAKQNPGVTPASPAAQSPVTDPNNLDARKLLGRIYLRSLGDMQGGTQSSEILKLAIEQFSQIVLLEPDNIDDHLLLGRLYIIDKDYVKAEGEFKAARHIQSDSEEAVINLAYLYNEEGYSTTAVDVLQSFPEGERRGKLYACLGNTVEQQQEFKRAIEAYKRAIDIDKDNLD